MTAKFRHPIFAALASKAAALFTVLALASAPGLPADVGQWKAIGSQGGLVLAMAVSPSNPSTIYAATDRRVYKSVDGGGSWDGSDLAESIHVLVPTRDPSVVYAARFGSACVHRSADGGHTFTSRRRPAEGAPAFLSHAVIEKGSSAYSTPETCGRVLRDRRLWR
jgi:hypothetical protein